MRPREHFLRCPVSPDCLYPRLPSWAVPCEVKAVQHPTCMHPAEAGAVTMPRKRSKKHDAGAGPSNVDVTPNKRSRKAKQTKKKSTKKKADEVVPPEVRRDICTARRVSTSQRFKWSSKPALKNLDYVTSSTIQTGRRADQDWWRVQRRAKRKGRRDCGRWATSAYRHLAAISLPLSSCVLYSNNAVAMPKTFVTAAMIALKLTLSLGYTPAHHTRGMHQVRAYFRLAKVSH
eukprot:362998-Chlamydomonas_euryale.AAC.3